MSDLTPITRKEEFIKRIYDKTQEVPEPITREEWFLNKAGEGGGGFIPTTEQLDAMNSGIDSTKVEQIATNESNISSLYGAYKNVVTNRGSALYTNTSGVSDIKFTFTMTGTQFESLKLTIADDSASTNADVYIIDPSQPIYIPSRYPQTYAIIRQIDGTSASGVFITAEYDIALDKTFQGEGFDKYRVRLFNGKSSTNLGINSVHIGYDTGTAATGEKNTSVGIENMRATTGARNSSIGYHSLFRATSGSDNSAIGAEAADDITTGAQNTALGAYALQRNSVGNNNTVVGYRALKGGQSSFTDSASFNGNTIVGTDSMKNMTAGDNNTAIGYNTLSGASNLSGCIAIGANANCTRNNQMMLGSSAVTEVVFCGNIKMNFNNDGTVTWEQLT